LSADENETPGCMNDSVDILVVGAGAAGIAAAVSAAREGRSTLLVDQRPAAGGTGGFSGITSLCGLYDEQGAALNGVFAAEFAAAIAEVVPVRMGRCWVLPYRPARFRAVAEDLLAATSGLRVRWNTRVTSAERAGERVVRINGWQVGAVIDCSGTAEVARALGIQCLETTAQTQAPAVVFPLCNVTRDLSTPAAAVKVQLPLARAGLPPLTFQASLEPGTVTVKLAASAEQVLPAIEFLRENVTGFEHCWTPVTEFAPAYRTGRMVPGQYLLTGADVLAGRKFPDAVARCAWPIEQWDEQGIVRFRYLESGTFYEIPERSLRAVAVQNLFMAGKTISADSDAIASARVMGTCLATGEAAGRLAASSLS
jgi:hypothetical protein